MWIFLNNAMISVVQNFADKNLLMMRARQPGDLESLGLAATETPDGDYRFRTTITRRAFKQIMADQIDHIDYSNFKDSIPKDDELRHRWYMGVWTVGVQLQEGGRYSMRDRR